MASSRIAISTANLPAAANLQSTVNMLAEVRSRISRLKAYADSAAAGGDWAAFAALFGVAEGSAQTVYNLILGSDSALNSGDLDGLVDRIAVQ